MSLIIFDYTVKICKQTLNTSKSARDTPYFYKAEEPDFKECTTEQLNKLYLDAELIMIQLKKMLEMRQ